MKHVNFRNADGMRSMSVFLRKRGAVPDLRVQVTPWFRIQRRKDIMNEMRRLER